MNIQEHINGRRNRKKSSTNLEGARLSDEVVGIGYFNNVFSFAPVRHIQPGNSITVRIWFPTEPHPSGGLET